MLTHDLEEIVLLHPVMTDFNLAKGRSRDEQRNSMRLEAEFAGFNPNPGRAVSEWDGVPFPVKRQFSNPFRRAVAEAYIRFRMMFTDKGKDPIEVFMDIKDSVQALDKAEPTLRKEHLQLMLSELERSKQKHAASMVKRELSIAEYEQILANNGFDKYLTEKDAIRFIKGSKRGLRLDPIQDFDRIIPETVLLRFDAAEKLLVFDNYYILHYDPSTKENPYYTAIQKKDPIMFGVIYGSTKLYLIEDWIDEHCDLTYKDIVAEVGDSKLSLF